MKYYLLSILFVLLVSCNRDKVYVCVSPTAHAYHQSRFCKGLRRCTHDIESETKEEAESQGRTPCHFCCR